MRTRSGCSTLLALVLMGCAGEGTEEAPRSAEADDTPSAMSIRIVEPADGAEVGPDSFRITLAAEGVEIVPAGTGGERTGHHHLLFNVDAPATGQPVPSIDGYVHLGQAQTGYITDLEPGEYRVIALLGDAAHFPHDPPIADTIAITVR